MIIPDSTLSYYAMTIISTHKHIISCLLPHSRLLHLRVKNYLINSRLMRVVRNNLDKMSDGDCLNLLNILDERNNNTFWG